MSNSKRKVCILTTVHHPFDTRIFHKQAKSLVEAGYDVTLIAQHDIDEVIEGVKIVALPKPKNRLQRMFGLTLRALRLALKQRSNIYHFHDPELIPIGILLRLLGKRVIYDVHEDVPQQILSKEWIAKPFRSIIAKAVQGIEYLGAKVFAAVVPATPKIGERFYNLNNHTVVVQNFPLLKELKVEGRPFTERPKAVTYVGGITELRGIYEMVKAMGLLTVECDAQLILGGTFTPSELQEKVKSLPGWNRVDYRGWLNRKQVAEVLANVRIGLVLIHPEPRYEVSYPVKMFEYMSAGVPVIASNFPLWKEIVEGNNCGLTVNPLDPQEIAGAIKYLLDRPELCEEMGKNGRRAVEEKYNWEREKLKLLELYSHLLN